MEVGDKATSIGSKSSTELSSNVITIGSSIQKPLRNRQGPVTLTNLPQSPTVVDVTTAVTVDISILVAYVT